jgi:hypothetical protein
MHVLLVSAELASFGEMVIERDSEIWLGAFCFDCWQSRRLLPSSSGCFGMGLVFVAWLGSFGRFEICGSVLESTHQTLLAIEE